jgi:hypothetical protein
MSIPPPATTSLLVPGTVSRNKSSKFVYNDLGQFASVLGKRMRGPVDGKAEHDKAKRNAASQPDKRTILDSDLDSESSFTSTSDFETEKNKRVKSDQGMRSTDHIKETINKAHS